MPRAQAADGVTNVLVTPTFSNVPAAATVRVSVLESINGGAPKPTFVGAEQPHPDASSAVEGPTIRLVLLPGASAGQRFIFQLADGVSHVVLGRVALSQSQLLSSADAPAWRVGAPDAAPDSEAFPAAAGEGDFALTLALEAGVGTALTQSGSVRPLAHNVDIHWADFPSFDHGSVRRELRQAASDPAFAQDFVEVEVAASGIAGRSAVNKASTLVSAHQAAGEYTLLDHTEVVEESHAPHYRQTLLVQVAHNGRPLPLDIVLRVYEASSQQGEIYSDSLLAQTAPLSLSALAAARKSGEQIHLALRMESNPALDKKLQKKKAEITIVSVRTFGEKRPRASAGRKVAPAAAAAAAQAGPSSSPKAGALAVEVPKPQLQRVLSRPTPVGGATPFESAAATPIGLEGLVIVDAAGREHPVPAPGSAGAASSSTPKGSKTPSSSGKSPKGSEPVSLSVGARNLPKLRAMASASSPLVALWEKRPEDKNADYTLLATTEAVVASSDPHFAQALSFSLAPVKTGLFSSTPKGSAQSLAEQFRLDVYDVADKRIEVASARVGFAFLSRAEISSIGGSNDYAERDIALRSDKPLLDKKLQSRQASVQLVRSGAPEAQEAQRQAARTSAVEAKRAAVAQKKAAWIESRKAQQAAAAQPIGAQAADAVVGAVEALAGGVSALLAGVVATAQGKTAEDLAAEEAAAAAQATPKEVPKEESAAAASAAPEPVEEKKEEKKEEPALASGAGLPPRPAAAAPAISRKNSLSEKGAGSRRGSGDHTKEFDDALLAEKVALARLEAAQRARDAHEGAVRSQKSDAEREVLDADLAQAKSEAAAATARAASAKEALAARRRARAEAEAAEAQAKAAAESAPGFTPWGARVKSVVSAGTGSGRSSRRQSLSLAEDAPTSGRTDISSLIMARRMAAQSAQSASQVALLPPRPAGSSSQIFALQVGVRNVKNSGAWNPCVAVYEHAASSSAAAATERWVYLDHTEKVEKVGESGQGDFKKQVLVEYFPSSSAADAAASAEEAQVLRFNIFNTGSKDEAGASDLIASGQASLSELAAAFANKQGAAVEVYLYSPGNRALSDRLKRQKACVVLTLAQSAEGSTAGGATAARGLVVGAAPVPLVLEGGADPDPAKQPFALVEAAPATAGADQTASSSDAVPAAAVEQEATAAQPEIGEGSMAVSASVEASKPAEDEEPAAAAEVAPAEAAVGEEAKPAADAQTEAPAKAAEEAPAAASEEVAASAAPAAAEEVAPAAAAEAAPAADEPAAAAAADESAAASSSDVAVGPGQKQCDSCKKVLNKKADFSAAQGKKPNGKCKSCVA